MGVVFQGIDRMTMSQVKSRRPRVLNSQFGWSVLSQVSRSLEPRGTQSSQSIPTLLTG
jgi:hypothetical protein